MGSDRARISYDEQQQYRSVVMQQGRVTVEADWNEAQLIASEEARREALDFVGPAGTPNNGYAITPLSPGFDFQIGAGTMYVGGVRAFLPQALNYSDQPTSNWMDSAIDPNWVAVPDAVPTANEYVYLFLREQEVSAVEDSDLKDVALGGPDTAQRTRLIQHIERLGVGTAADCPSALAAATPIWSADGFALDPNDLRVRSFGRLQVGFVPTGTSTPCDPVAQGGYLGADNQLIRIQVSESDAGGLKFLWGYDDASFLYRVTVADPQHVTLQSAPVDAEHIPQGGQAVEILMDAAELANGQYVAAPTGQRFTLATAPYNSDTKTLSLPSALNSVYGDGTSANPGPKQVYLRVWQQELPFTGGAAVTLGDTGVQVTLTTTNKNTEPFRVGDYWMFAVRPGTPQQVYPERYLSGAQAPDGPREWICPLAVIPWSATPLAPLNCRNTMCNLVNLCKSNGGGCCTVKVSPTDLVGTKTLQTIVDQYAGLPGVNVCLSPGTYALAEPLTLNSENSNLHFEACAGGVIFNAAVGANQAISADFLSGLVVVNSASNVSFKGIEFQLPLVPLGSTSVATAAGTTSASAAFSIGVQLVNCTDVSIEDCTFEFGRAAASILLSAGILARGNCVGLSLEGNTFELAPFTAFDFEAFLNNEAAAATLAVGFAMFPSVISNEISTSGLVRSGASAQVLSAELQNAVIRSNSFSGLTICALVYADCGLVEIEANIVRTCNWGFWILTLPALAYADNTADIAVAAPFVTTAKDLQSALTATLGHPAIQFAAAQLRSFPLPQKVDLSQAIPVTVRKTVTTLNDTSAVQTLFDRAVSVPTAGTKADTQTIKLSDVSAPAANLVEAAAGTTPEITLLNQNLNIIEKIAFPVQTLSAIPLALHATDNDISLDATGAASGLGVFVWDLGTNDQDAVSLTGNTIVGGNTTLPMALIGGTSRARCTGNMILNEANERIVVRGVAIAGPSLWLFPVSVETINKLPVFAAAVTGNVFRGAATLPARNLSPVPPAPMDTWHFFNAET